MIGALSLVLAACPVALIGTALKYVGLQCVRELPRGFLLWAPSSAICGVLAGVALLAGAIEHPSFRAIVISLAAVQVAIDIPFLGEPMRTVVQSAGVRPGPRIAIFFLAAHLVMLVIVVRLTRRGVRTNRV